MTLREALRVRQALQQTRRRHEKVALLADWLRRLAPGEEEAAVALLTGALPWGKSGVGPGLLQRAWENLPPGTDEVPLAEVLDHLHRIAQARGQDDKVRLLRDLFRRLSPAGRALIAEVLVGEVRQGAGERTLLEAIARAFDLDADTVQRAYLYGAPLADLIRQARAGTVRPEPRLFTPLRPMLATPAAALDLAHRELGGTGLYEFKLDGARFQAHRLGSEVRVFSRHLRDITATVPEIVEAVRRLPADRLIVEGEAVALDENGRPVPFQVFMRRFGKRRHIEEARQRMPLVPFFFDLLYLDGDLTTEPLERRRHLLFQLAPEEHRIPALQTSRMEEAEVFYRQALDWGAEGLMAKRLDAPYVVGERVGLWLKIKPAETADCVIIAAEWGHGRRRGWLSNLHLAVWDPGRKELLPVGKTFKGLTDRDLAWLTRELLKRKVAEEPGIVYVKPEIVVEVAYSEVQQSPRYPSGVALRFARVKRFRPDKPAREASTLADLLRSHAR